MSYWIGVVKYHKKQLFIDFLVLFNLDIFKQNGI